MALLTLLKMLFNRPQNAANAVSEIQNSNIFWAGIPLTNVSSLFDNVTNFHTHPHPPTQKILAAPPQSGSMKISVTACRSLADEEAFST